jgi:hypothetical protein
VPPPAYSVICGGPRIRRRKRRQLADG